MPIVYLVMALFLALVTCLYICRAFTESRFHWIGVLFYGLLASLWFFKFLAMC